MQYVKCCEQWHEEHTVMVLCTKAIKVIEMAGLLQFCKSRVSPEQGQEIGNIPHETLYSSFSFLTTYLCSHAEVVGMTPLKSMHMYYLHIIIFIPILILHIYFN